jgi:uncharacterized protein with FMN-binding domain
MSKKSARGVKKRPTAASAPRAADGISRVVTPSAGNGWRKRRRITDGLIGLSSAIVLSVYAVGYVRTRETDEPLVTQNMAQSQIQMPNQHPSASPANGSQQAGVYRDGTYVAIGTSRHGPIEARVVVKDGRITSASVSRCGTRYPCSDVNPLVKQVLSRQSAPVDYVSGATDSSQAYTEAVKNALAQAS